MMASRCTQPHRFVTFASVDKVRIPLEPFGAVADVAWPVGRIEALAAVGDAGVRPARLLLGYLACLVADGPVHQQRRPPAVSVKERRRRGVARGEREVGRLNQRRVAAAADIVDP